MKNITLFEKSIKLLNGIIIVILMIVVYLVIIKKYEAADLLSSYVLVMLIIDAILYFSFGKISSNDE